MAIKLTQPIPGKTPEETVRNIIDALRQQQFELEHYLSHLDASAITSINYGPVVNGPKEWEDTATNFNNRNDRNQVIPSNPVVADDGTAVDHTVNTDGSANISFEWSFEGTGPAYDVDGFIVYVYASNVNEPYTFGTYLGLESVNYVPAATWGYIIEGVPADQFYTFGVRSYRNVDQDIDPSGILKSSIIKSAYEEEDPYQPESEVAFAGSIAGTLGNKPASEIVDFVEVDYPADQIVVNNQIAQKKRVFKTTPTPPYDSNDIWCPGSTGEFMICTTAKTAEEEYDPDDWEPASDSVRLGTKYNLNSISTEDGFKSEETSGNYTQMNAGGLKHHQKTTATLSGTLSDSATSMTVSADVFPPAPFLIRIDLEIIRVNAKSGTVFTSISRGQAGSTSAAHNSGSVVLLTKDYFYLIEIGRVSTIGYKQKAYDLDPPDNIEFTGEEEYLMYVPPITIQLPDDFKGKVFQVYAELRMNGKNLDTYFRRVVIAMAIGSVQDILWVCEAYDHDFINATFKIKAYGYMHGHEANKSSQWYEMVDGVDISYTVTA